MLLGKFEAVQRVEEEEPLPGTFDTAQRIEEEEPLQRKFDPLQRVEEDQPVKGKFETTQLAEAPMEKHNNTGLPDNLKSGIESLSGLSMDSVRVHYNSSQPTQLNALAYVQGNDIHVAPGQAIHMPHEAMPEHTPDMVRDHPPAQKKAKHDDPTEPATEQVEEVMGGRAQPPQKNHARPQNFQQVTHPAHYGPPIAQRVIIGNDSTGKADTRHQTPG